MITDFLKENLLYLDGGMGTLLQKKGLPVGELPERWCLSHPSAVTEIHRAYYDAGSHVVNTNTFGANALKMDETELERVICAAIGCARAAQRQSRMRESGSETVGREAAEVGGTGYRTARSDAQTLWRPGF